MRAFQDNPWFASLSRASADALLAAATPLRLAAGECAFRQGDKVEGQGGAFFGVTQGLIKLQALNPDGKEVILVLAEPGNWFGEVAALESLPRAQTAVALVDTELLVVSADRFNALMRHGEFAASIARLVARRLRQVYVMMYDAGLLGPRERVARRLVWLAHGDITNSVAGRTTLRTSQDVLAMMLGISRPTLNKELQALAELGALALCYGRIEIKDMALLYQAASIHGYPEMVAR